MIGPGWMPSRPRPLARVRRGLRSYAPGLRPRRRRADDAPGEPAAEVEASRLGRRIAVTLPTATLRPGRAQPRHQRIGGPLLQWLAERWTWLRPRAVPLVAAIVGMFAVMAAEQYLTELARGMHQPVVQARSRCAPVTEPGTPAELRGAPAPEAAAPGTPVLPGAPVPATLRSDAPRPARCR